MLEELELTNVSAINCSTLKLGGNIKLTGKAVGGKAPYTYAVYYKKTFSKSWVTKQDFGVNTVNTIKPLLDTRYHILVKAMDSDGTIAKKYFKLSVEKPAAAENDK